MRKVKRTLDRGRNALPPLCASAEPSARHARAHARCGCRHAAARATAQLPRERHCGLGRVTSQVPVSAGRPTGTGAHCNPQIHMLHGHTDVGPLWAEHARPSHILHTCVLCAEVRSAERGDCRFGALHSKRRGNAEGAQRSANLRKELNGAGHQCDIVRKCEHIHIAHNVAKRQKRQTGQAESRSAGWTPLRHSAFDDDRVRRRWDGVSNRRGLRRVDRTHHFQQGPRRACNAHRVGYVQSDD